MAFYSISINFPARHGAGVWEGLIVMTIVLIPRFTLGFGCITFFEGGAGVSSSAIGFCGACRKIFHLNSHGLISTTFWFEALYRGAPHCRSF
jgi:hypothetical protein